MRWDLRDELQQYEILDLSEREPTSGEGATPRSHERPRERRTADWEQVRFDSYSAALSFFRRFFGRPDAMDALREAVQRMSGGSDVSGFSDDEVMDRLAGLAESGLVRVIIPPPPSRVRWTVSPGGKGDPTSPASPAKKAAEEGGEGPVEWCLVWSDGPGVKGFISQFEPPQDITVEEKEPDGKGSHKFGSYRKDSPYAVTLVGQIAAEGEVQDAEGAAVPKARVRLERAHGEAAELQTGGDGKFKSEGLVKEEEFEVYIYAFGKVELSFVDHEDKAMSGVSVTLWKQSGEAVPLRVDGGGKIKLDEISLCEVATVEVVATGVSAEGTITDESGKPVAGAQLTLWFDGGGAVSCTTDEGGKYKIENRQPGEGYSLQISPRASGSGG